MKSKLLIGLTLALVLVLATVSLVSAKNERIDFTYTESCDPSTIDIAREIMNGHGNYLARHWTQTCFDTGSISQFNGTWYGDLNLEIVGNGRLLMNAKATLVTEEGGMWNFNCVSQWPMDYVKCIGQGEGIYKGLQIFTEAFPGEFGSGYIVDPGG